MISSFGQARRRSPLAVQCLILAVLFAGCSKHEFVSRAANAPSSFVIRNVRVFDAPHAALLDGPRDVSCATAASSVAPPGVAAAGLPRGRRTRRDAAPGSGRHAHAYGGQRQPAMAHRATGTGRKPGRIPLRWCHHVLDAGALTPAIFQLRDRVRTGAVLSPHLYAAGPMFTSPNGHPVGLMRANLPFWARWYVLPRIAREVATPDAGRRAVADLLPDHPDVIKIAVDDLVPGEPRIGTQVIAAIVTRAHEGDVRVVAHIGQSRDVIDAVGAGVDALMHDVYTDPISDEAVARVGAAHIPVVATIGIWDAVEEMGTLRPETRSPITRGVAKPAVLAALSAFPSEQERARLTTMNTPIRDGHAARRANVAKLRAAGVTILAGSDAVNAGQFPGAGLHDELAKLVEAGITPGEPLCAATSDNARFLAGAQADFGEVAPGKRADLILVHGDPTTDIAATQRITHVWLDGVELVRYVRPTSDSCPRSDGEPLPLCDCRPPD